MLEFCGFVAVGLALWLVFRHIFFNSKKLRGSLLQRNPISPRTMRTPTVADGFSFGGYPLSFDDARLHFLVIGSPGSGKTCLILLLMQSACHRLVCGPEKVRMMVYDSKTDLVSKIAGMDGVDPEQIRIMNPLDARCSAWDMARDLTNTFYAQEFAETLIPYDKTRAGENSHFAITAQLFLAAIIEALNYRAALKWDFRDVLNVARSTNRMLALFRSCPDTEELVEQHFSVEKTALAVKSSMDSYLRQFRPVAAIWHQAAKERSKVSIREWIEGSGQILVLGNDPQAKAGLAAINRLLFDQAAKAVRSVPGEPADKQSWFFLDELSELGELKALKDLLITGRSKNCAVVLGFQDIQGIDAAYQKENAREIIGQPQNIAVVHLNPAASETKKWASECIGKWEFKRHEHGYSSSRSIHGGSSSHNVQERFHIQDVLLPSQFESDLPKASASHGLTGLFRIRQGLIREGFPQLKSGWFLQHIRPQILFGPEGDLSRLRPKHPSFDDFIPRDEAHFHLSDWTPDDIRRLGIPEFWELKKKKESVIKSSAPAIPQSSLDPCPPLDPSRQ